MVWQYVMYLGLMDFVLQVLSILIGINDEKLMFLFVVQEFEVFSVCIVGMWVYVRFFEDYKVGQVEKCDFDICDENGKVCVRLKGLLFRMVEKEFEKKEEVLEMFMFEFVWI